MNTFNADEVRLSIANHQQHLIASNEPRQPGSMLSGLRRTCGALVVRIGERVQGDTCPEPCLPVTTRLAAH